MPDADSTTPTIDDAKAGARHSAADVALLKDSRQMLRQIDANLVQLGTPDDAPAEAAAEGEAANALKAMGSTADELTVGNYIVLFGGRDLAAFEKVEAMVPTRKNLDGSRGEFFTKNTKFESEYTATGRLPVDWEHNTHPEEVGPDAVLGYVDWSTKAIDDKGVFVKRVLNRHNKYVKWLEELIKVGLVGNSSETQEGTGRVKATGEIVIWPLMRDTLTITPTEPRMKGENVIAALKALGLSAVPGQAAPDGATAVAPVPGNIIERINPMSDTDVATLTEAVKSLTTELADVKAKLNAPALPVAPGVVAVPDNKPPFKSLGEQLMAVRAAATGVAVPEQVNKLEAVKALKAASGSNELVQSDGAFLVQSDFSTNIFERIYSTGAIASRTTKQAVGANANGVKIPAVDEQSRADGSRFGGVRGYWTAEAGTITSSYPKWRQVVLELKKLAALVYATDELLADAAAFESYVMRVVPLELGFKLEDAIFNGIGGAVPLGITAAPATVSVAKESGQAAAATVVYANIVKMYARMWAAGFSNAVWYINQDVLPALFQMSLAVGTGGAPVWLPPSGLSGSPYSTLLGRPVIPVEQCQTLGTVGDIILVDPSQYVLADKGSVVAAQSIHVQFLTDQTAYRWTYRVDGQPLWNTALTPFKGSNTISPFVTLATRS